VIIEEAPTDISTDAAAWTPHRCGVAGVVRGGIRPHGRWVGRAGAAMARSSATAPMLTLMWWMSAGRCVVAAAFGAPALVLGNDREQLLTGWTRWRGA